MEASLYCIYGFLGEYYVSEEPGLMDCRATKGMFLHGYRRGFEPHKKEKATIVAPENSLH